jgi:hypothetical protein
MTRTRRASDGERVKKGNKVLKESQKEAVEDEVSLLLHASRDCLRNIGIDTKIVDFRSQDGYYAEAYGVMRGLKILGYGYLGPHNQPDGVVPHHNLNWWFDQICRQVLEEEGFHDGTHRCDYCLDKWGKDDTRKRA